MLLYWGGDIVTGSREPLYLGRGQHGKRVRPSTHSVVLQKWRKAARHISKVQERTRRSQCTYWKEKEVYRPTVLRY